MYITCYSFDCLTDEKSLETFYMSLFILAFFKSYLNAFFYPYFDLLFFQI